MVSVLHRCYWRIMLLRSQQMEQHMLIRCFNLVMNFGTICSVWLELLASQIQLRWHLLGFEPKGSKRQASCWAGKDIHMGVERFKYSILFLMFFGCGPSFPPRTKDQVADKWLCMCLISHWISILSWMNADTWKGTGYWGTLDLNKIWG